jgi:hypothetical protein
MLVVEAELLPPAGYQAGGAGARVIEAERSAIRFADAAGVTNVKTEITQFTCYLRRPWPRPQGLGERADSGMPAAPGQRDSCRTRRARPD